MEVVQFTKPHQNIRYEFAFEFIRDLREKTEITVVIFESVSEQKINFPLFVSESY